MFSVHWIWWKCIKEKVMFFIDDFCADCCWLVTERILDFEEFPLKIRVQKWGRNPNQKFVVKLQPGAPYDKQQRFREIVSKF
jgi:hypothetical protein